MVVPYTKPYKTFSEQIKLLQDRGMVFKVPDRAESILSSVGYYHLSAYWYPFRKVGSSTEKVLDDFKAGVSFEDVCSLMRFDVRLRSILFGMLTDIELWLRCSIAYVTGKRHPFGYYTGFCIDPMYLSGGEKQNIRDKWLAKLDRQIQGSKEIFIEHFRSKYLPPLPVWVSCELWDFGMSSKLFDMLSRSFKDAIPRRLGIKSSSTLANWLHIMNIVRNICAHNARLWNRHVVVHMKIPSPQQLPALSFLRQKGYAPESMAAIIFIIVWLHRQIAPQSAKCQELKEHLDSLSAITLPDLSHSMMGFQIGWEAESIWESLQTSNSK